jgi:hypothetical protein
MDRVVKKDGDSEPETQIDKVAIDVAKLHLVKPEEATRIFDTLIGSGTVWNSPLMQYRTTSDFQAGWKVEVGNWLERARRLGFLDYILRNIVPHQLAPGERAAGDAVHRNVTQQLAQAQATHYFVGTGWTFQAWEPIVSETRGNGARADVDLQLVAPTGQVVDLQVKASRRLGLDDHEVDDHIQKGVQKAATQLPTPGIRLALIAVLAQRDWPLSSNIDVIEHFIGNTSGPYPDGTVLLHDQEMGEFSDWAHVSGIVVLDHLRGLGGADYGCILLQNPWADYPVDPAWFPYAQILTSSEGSFTWLWGHPTATTFPTGTRCFRGTVNDAMRLHGTRRSDEISDAPSSTEWHHD